MTTPPASPASASSLVNAEPVVVTRDDGSTETVELRRLTIRQRYQWARHVHDNKTPELVALCTGHTPEWVDSLSVESFAELASRCVTENFRTAMTIAEKDPVMAMLLGPVVATGIMSVADMLKAQATNQPGPSGSDSSPAPAPSASAEAIGSASST